MIKNDFIAIISPNQFEIKIPYPSTRGAAKLKYNTRIYFFIPKKLNINPDTYSSSHFYNDYISYLRLITPETQLGIVERRFIALILSLKKGVQGGLASNAFEKELKLVVSSYVAYLEVFSREFPFREIRHVRLCVFLQRVKRLHGKMQTLIATAIEQGDDALVDISLSASEFLSYAAQNCLLEVNTHLRSHADRYSDTINDIVDLINTLIRFCKEHDFPIISNDTYQNDKVIYRYSILKKHFYGVTFLYQKKKRDGGGIKEFYYAIAAGISMIFTTLIVFATQKEYGNFTMSFFAALVISYMFKDRIKEAYRSYFDKKLAINTYDYKEKIYSMDHKRLFAFIKERMRFVRKEKLPDNILKSRLVEVPRRLASYIEEDIIRFEKNVILHNGNIQGKFNHSIEGIHNIMRFDLSQYFKKMDAVKVPLYRARETKLFGRKIYHVNIIVEEKSKQGTRLNRARIVLDKKGIKRIEIPGSDRMIFTEAYLSQEQSWFAFKKSGLIKKSGPLAP